MLPLGLLIGLSPLVYKAIKLNLVTAIIVSLIIVEYEAKASENRAKFHARELKK